MKKAEALAAIGERVPPNLWAHRQQGGSDIYYLRWFVACDLMDKRVPGWSFELPFVGAVGDEAVVVAKVTIPCEDGDMIRCATGRERLDKTGYGDPTSNAESMALRRAFAKFGLGLEAYGLKKPKKEGEE